MGRRRPAGVPQRGRCWSPDDGAEPARLAATGPGRSRRAAGRVRDPDRRFGPRTLDVDVIAVWADDGTPVISDDPELTLPHPRAHLRAFVLRPWIDIQPYARLPGHGWLTDLLNAEPLADRRPGAAPDARSADRVGVMDPESPPRGPTPDRPRMGPTRPADARRRRSRRCCRGLAAGQHRSTATCRACRGCPRSCSPALAVLEGYAALNTRARIERKPGRDPVDPLAVARYVVLAKASVAGRRDLRRLLRRPGRLAAARAHARGHERPAAQRGGPRRVGRRWSWPRSGWNGPAGCRSARMTREMRMKGPRGPERA